MTFRRFQQAVAWRYRRFVRRQGFVVMTVLCAAVIAGSAAWTQQGNFRRVSPTSTPDAASAADLWQQSLRDAATPSPTPADDPGWLAPLGALTVLRAFDAEKLVPTGITGLWQVHDALDLAAAPGDPVFAMRDGTVLGIAEHVLLGVCVTVDHGGGFVAEYAGLSPAEALVPGQAVRAGQTLGMADGGSHGLHLRVTLDGMPVDPAALLPSQP